MRVVTWNMHGARASRQPAWEYLLELKPDIAFLQEVGEIPLQVTAQFECKEAHAVRQNGRPQRFKTALLARGQITDDVALPLGEPWIERELRRFSGNLLSFRVEPEFGPAVNAINVYNPAWPRDRTAFQGVDTSAARLKHQARDVWLADLLCSRLGTLLECHPEPWIVAGDFNLSESYDEWPRGPHGNREFLDRMADLGLVECLRKFAGKQVPTFKNADGGAVLHQIDHMFVSSPLAAGLTSATTGSQEHVFGAHLSDHLPVIADIDVA